MRAFFAAILLCLSALYIPAFAQGTAGGPDSIYVPDRGYVARGEVSPLPASRFGTFTKAPKSLKKVAGRTFNQTPGVVSYHSDASAWIAEARRYTGMTGAQLRVKHVRLWCGEFLGRIADRIGARKPGNPNWAADWAEVGPKISGPRPGAIALVARGRRIGHVGIVTGVDANGNPILISGNHNDRVVETTYRAGSIVAYIWPGA